MTTTTNFKNLLSLNGQSVIVTGGGGGIGRAIAAMFSSAGADVALVDLNIDAATAAAESVNVGSSGGRATAFQCDISKPGEVEATFAKVSKVHGRLDVLVNNAALIKRTPALETTIETWRQVMEVNLDGAFLCACEAVRHMKKEGSIVNVASIMGLSGGGIYPIASYQASKGGLVNLTRGLAVEWAEKGVRVNAVAPAWVRTELTKPLLDDPEMSGKLLELIPMRRFADVNDVAAAVLYLASSAAKFVTGHVLAVDGGYLAR